MSMEPEKKIDSEKRPKIVIVGGGFGGLYVARGLRNREVDVTLIDRKNHHTFQPLLYQVALAALSPGDISNSLRHIFHKADNVRTILGNVTDFDLTERKVFMESGESGTRESLEYDYLIVAAGARHSYFGNDQWEAEAPGLKTLEDAVEIRCRLLLTFEKAEKKAILTGKTDPITFVVIGGGPTGVELAGAIADLAHRSLAKDFKVIDTKKSRVLLYEGSPRVLGTFSPESSASAQKQLEELGVEVHTNSLVSSVEAGRIQSNGQWISSDVTLWATGVAASPLGKKLGVETDRAGRVSVEQDLSLPGHRDVFVIGDMARLTDANGVQVPGLASSAMQEGKFLAKNILAEIEGKDRKLFRYNNRGTMATIGRHRAIAEIGKRRFSGFIAWALWLLIHLQFLIGFRNRLSVLRQWAWAYFMKESGSPLITEYRDNEREIKAAE